MSRILIIDDDHHIREVQKTILASAGHEIVEADDGRSATRLLKKDKEFDLILCDIAMPDLDGISFKAKLNNDERLKHIPIIFVSANKTHHYKMVSKIMGAIDFIAKPFSPRDLLEKVECLLPHHETRVPLAEDELILPE